MPYIYDMGQTALLPSEGRRVEDFFALKNPTTSVGLEPTNLGTKGQHATSRPPKPQFYFSLPLEHQISYLNEKKIKSLSFFIRTS